MVKLLKLGLSTGTYFIYRLDDNTFQLAETKYDVDNEPPKVVGITTNTGGSSQELSLINPPLSIVKNNDLVFYVSDSSLSDMISIYIMILILIINLYPLDLQHHSYYQV